VQTSIAQVLALVVFGNRFFAGRCTEGFWPNGTVSTFYRNVRFLNRQGQTIAANPQAWFETLKARQTPRQRWFGGSTDARSSGLQLRYGGVGEDARMTVGFVGGGGRWLIEDIVEYARCSLWEGHWTLGDRNAPDRKIWEVSYNCLGEGKPSPAQSGALIPSIRKRMDTVLREIETFAREAGAIQFANCFKDAYLALASTDPLEGLYHSEFREDAGLTLPAKQLLGAIFRGWVFGGMGSWNDGPTGDNARHELLSAQLFDVLTQGTVAVANSTFAPQ
jgi:hypothetical protein